MIQINPRSPIVKKIFQFLIFAVIFHLAIGWFKGCSSESKKKNTQTIAIPAVSGKFEPKKPDAKPLEIIQEPINEVKKDGTVYVTNPLNEKLAKENEKLKSDFAALKNDSLKQKVYEKAIELNSFSTKFEDDNLLLNINGTVRGEVQEITPSYTIKERKTEVVVPETILRVFIGAGVGINTDLDRGVYKLDLNFMNRKGDIFSGEYLRVNGQDFGMIGIKKSILNIKR